MNSRNRFRTAINHTQPDKTPLDFGTTNVTTIHKDVYSKLLAALDIQDPELKIMDFTQQLVIPCEAVLQRFNIDTRCVKLKHSPSSATIFTDDNEFIDDWGMVWKRPEGGLYYDVVNKALCDCESVEDVWSYSWPKTADLASAQGVYEEARRIYETTEYAIIGSFGSSIYNRAQLMRGFEQLFVDMLVDPEIVGAILDNVLEIRIGLVSMLLDAAGEYLDVIEIADDLAGQDGPLFSIELYRDIIKQRTKTLIDYIKARSNAKIMYHCCGSVCDFVEDFIEIGIDILNPVQVSASGMDSKLLKEKFGDRIAFWGGIDAQHVLPHGTPTDVIAETVKRLEDFNGDGGYVASASHNIQADVPVENIIAMFDALSRYR